MHWQSSHQNFKVYIATAKHGHTEVITVLNIKLPGKNHKDLLEAKINSDTKSKMLPLRALGGCFPTTLLHMDYPSMMLSSKWSSSF